MQRGQSNVGHPRMEYYDQGDNFKNTASRAQFEQLADVPPEEEWLANITNLKTRRAYKEDVREFYVLDYREFSSAALPCDLYRPSPLVYLPQGSSHTIGVFPAGTEEAKKPGQTKTLNVLYMG